MSTSCDDVTQSRPSELASDELGWHHSGKGSSLCPAITLDSVRLLAVRSEFEFETSPGAPLQDRADLQGADRPRSVDHEA